VILELEREKKDVLIIAHESVLRVLYGYLMACSTQDIPSLGFPRNEIVEVRTTCHFFSPDLIAHLFFRSFQNLITINQRELRSLKLIPGVNMSRRYMELLFILFFSLRNK
jgi:broad specificity phosphatase PhoE